MAIWTVSVIDGPLANVWTQPLYLYICTKAITSIKSTQKLKLNDIMLDARCETLSTKSDGHTRIQTVVKYFRIKYIAKSSVHQMRSGTLRRLVQMRSFLRDR